MWTMSTFDKFETAASAVELESYFSDYFFIIHIFWKSHKMFLEPSCYLLYCFYTQDGKDTLKHKGYRYMLIK